MNSNFMHTFVHNFMHNLIKQQESLIENKSLTFRNNQKIHLKICYEKYFRQKLRFNGLSLGTY